MSAQQDADEAAMKAYRQTAVDADRETIQFAVEQMRKCREGIALSAVGLPQSTKAFLFDMETAELLIRKEHGL